MEHVLLFLKAPTNIEKTVRELQVALYREAGLVSALALPVMIPLCFVSEHYVSKKATENRDALRRAMGKLAPFLRSGAVVEQEGCLFWDLEPREELQRLHHSGRQVFGREGLQSDAPRPAAKPPRTKSSKQVTEQAALFPVARGFFLCSLEGQAQSALPSLPFPKALRFPAKGAALLRFRPLEADLEPGKQRDTTSRQGPWWRSLFWEELERIPLRKAK
ncbi:MAG: hypothetical protein JSV89_05730 [Spirochaetaceae bacterium]|nr:MAG: hypothetical protein JSV89_05730 [Spirochaetaceae bacterium]